MSNFLLRGLAVILWAGVLALTLAIVADYAGAQGPVPAGLAFVAVIGSAFGGMIAGRCWENRRLTAAAVALSAMALGEAYLVPIEIGFWANLVRQRAADSEMAELRRSGVIAEMKAKQQLSWGETIRQPDDVRAERKAELAQPVTYVNASGVHGVTKSLGEWTRACEDEKHWAFRAGRCAHYLELAKELAKAEAAERARDSLSKPDGKLLDAALPPDPHAGAKWFEHRVGLLGFQVWSELFMLTGVALVMVLRCGALFIAFSAGPAAAALPSREEDAASERSGWLAGQETAGRPLDQPSSHFSSHPGSQPANHSQPQDAGSGQPQKEIEYQKTNRRRSRPVLAVSNTGRTDKSAEDRALLARAAEIVAGAASQPSERKLASQMGISRWKAGQLLKELQQDKPPANQAASAE